MKLEINKPSVWIPIALTVIGMVAGGIVWAYHEFVPREIHNIDKAAMESELAGVSLNQQRISCRQNIKWYEQDLRDFKKRHGHPPYQNHDVQQDYEELMRNLEDERKYCTEVKQKIKK